MKVYELAKELDIGAIDLVEKLKDIGMNVRNHMVALSDDEVEQAKLKFKPSKPTTKKKASKKVVRKKVTKKKVIKKSAPAEEAKEEAPKVEDKPLKEKEVVIEAKTPVEAKEQEEASVDKKKDDKKVVTVKRRTKKDVAEKNAEEAAQRKETKDKKDYLDVKDSLHTFTPVLNHPQSGPENTDSNDKKESRVKSFTKPAAGTEDADDDKSKKRIGDLATIMSKKGVAGRSKDLTQLRADEELKFATHIVGRQVYTPAKRKKVYTGSTKNTEITEVKDSKRVVVIHDVTTAEELSDKLAVKFEELKNAALKMNLLLKKDDYIGFILATEIAALYDYRVENRAFKEEEALKTTKVKDKDSLPARNPVITIMGHVDHGKTTLLDYIREAKVASGEAGGITQHIGAYSVLVKDGLLTFLDTPGHAAFASMRQRGANVTDVVVLVVAADDGVMPQTKESVKYCQNANVPIIVAVNKMDKEEANPDRVKNELMEFGLTPEEWGGETQYIPISALKGDGVDKLLESIHLQTEMMELRANPKGASEGIVIESKIEQGRGPVATVIIQSGTLKKGDTIVVGETSGRARSLMDSFGKMLKEAGPSTPVQILGLNEAPTPGDTLQTAKNDREAKKVVDKRVEDRKALEQASSKKVSSLEDFFATTAAGEGEKKILNLIIRSDVQGSFEAIKNSLESLGNDEVGLNVIAGGVGAISDSDVNLAANTEGYIIGFNMRPVTSARRLAEEKGVDIKTYSIIYELINEVKLALEGMLEPDYVEKFIGRAQVKDTFNIPKIGVIAGSSVVDGKIERGCNIRLLREGKIVFDGKLSSLKRFKDDVKEVKNGYECGISLDGFNDVKVDDLFEAYILEQKERTLESKPLS